jgi:hypothetical protein
LKQNTHTHQQVKKIDRFIREHYPDYGPDYCAAALDEPRKYIQQRAWFLHVKQKSRKKRQPTQREHVVKQPKHDDEIARLRAENKELRKELIKMVAKYRTIVSKMETVRQGVSDVLD